MSQQLIRYNAMCSAIDAAYEIDEVKDIRDQAVALEAYAKQAKNTEAERRACEVRLRAERKAGQLLAKMEKARPRGSNQHKVKDRSPDATGPLLDLGISKNQSSNWQKLGAIPQSDFDLALQQADKPTTTGIIRATVEPKPDPVSDDALWLWGRLRDFDRNLLAKNPSEVMKTMTAEMKDSVHALAPRVAAWLKNIGAINGQAH